jgi:hypothetical protein
MMRGSKWLFGKDHGAIPIPTREHVPRIARRAAAERSIASGRWSHALRMLLLYDSACSTPRVSARANDPSRSGSAGGGRTDGWEHVPSILRDLLAWSPLRIRMPGDHIVTSPRTTTRPAPCVVGSCSYTPTPASINACESMIHPLSSL